jgi:putative ABC transport system permease protein
MKHYDLLRFNVQLFARHRWRTGILATCIALGVASVVLLTSLGESARHYVNKEFSMLGNNLLIVLPGKKQTSGGGIPFYASSSRDLTLQDAHQISRLPGIKSLSPIIAGTSHASYSSRGRDITVLGATRGFLDARKLVLSMGRTLPADADTQARNVVIIGSKLRQELFAGEPPLGKMLSVDDYRYQVIGVLAERGESMGLDLRDMIIIPVRSAEALFNSPALFRILVELHSVANQQQVMEAIYALIKQRHQGEEDITIITEQSVLSAFNNIMMTLTAVVGLLASVSLLVAGILIMNLTLISVQQRRPEIGLLKALGASRGLIQRLFMLESLMLVGAAAVLGLGCALLLLWLANQLIPEFEFLSPVWSHLAALLAALCTGLLFSWLPARQAAAVSPVDVLRG